MKIKEKINIKLLNDNVEYSDIAYFVGFVLHDEKFLNAKEYENIFYMGKDEWQVYGRVAKYKKSITIEIGKGK